jgi:hypothetical protein
MKNIFFMACETINRSLNVSSKVNVVQYETFNRGSLFYRQLWYKWGSNDIVSSSIRDITCYAHVLKSFKSAVARDQKITQNVLCIFLHCRYINSNVMHKINDK